MVHVAFDCCNPFLIMSISAASFGASSTNELIAGGLANPNFGVSLIKMI